MASLLLENCVFSLESKASTSSFGALNSTSSISSFLGLVVRFLGTFLSPDLPSDGDAALLGEVITDSSLPYLNW